MAEHRYAGSRITVAEQQRLVRKVAVGLGGLLALLLLATLVPAARQVVVRDPRWLAVSMAAWYLAFLRPSRLLSQALRLKDVVVRSNRRGITLVEGAHESTLLWREVERAEVDTEEVPGVGVRWRAIRLYHGRAHVLLKNEPPGCALEGAAEVLEQVVRMVDRVRVRFTHVGFAGACPLCGTQRGTSGPCAACGQQVRRLSPWLRPGRLFRDDALYLCVLPLVGGPSMLPVVVIFLFALVMRPWLLTRLQPLQPLLRRVPPGGLQREADPQGSTVIGRPGLVRLALVVGCFLPISLSARPLPAPSPSGTPAPRLRTVGPSLGRRLPVALPAPSGQPAPGAQDYLPLAVGNTWEYACNGSRVVQRVTAEETVNGVRCWVLESFVGGESESTQRESFTVTPQGLTVLKRTHRGADIFLSPGQLMLAYPVRSANRWTWTGNADLGAVTYEFVVESPTTMTVAGRTFTAVPISFTGRAGDGSDLQTRRWYVRGVGMVREKTTLRKGAKMFRLDAVLQNFALRVPAAPLPDTQP